MAKASVEIKSIDALSDSAAMYLAAKSTTTVASGKTAAPKRLSREGTDDVQQMQ
jgi:hypothetical protein